MLIVSDETLENVERLTELLAATEDGIVTDGTLTRVDDAVVLTLMLDATADDVVSDETLTAPEDAEGLT